ncbi:hypothetical protein [Leptospira bandrabouensis]|uniref:hypothetical protein n=1 Tax=Leptospira bandrabouensis TaxID=2484903 RepID=UPI001EE83B87|nr:hypothetical protein [Leptospira bandrabouensis]MCG6144512.1 hypothetical protein [Leptospira bandrabouensis]MCG6160173.1 hypothetical protein [Leptospira bandrabouensis]MCG6164106.1 hypothetical protein [Leptospira bandrabouensis]
MRNFAEQNINAAQDRTQDDQNKAKLIASRQYSADEVANMSGQEIDNALGELPKETPNALDAFLGSIGNYIDNNINTGIDLAVSIGGSIAGGAALLYGIGANPGSSNNNPPNTQNVVATEPNRKREYEDNNDVADNQDTDRTNDQTDSDLVNSNDTSEFASVIDPMNPNSTDPVGVGGVDNPAHEFTMNGSYDPLEGEKGGGEVRVYDRAELQSLSASKLNKLVTAELGKPEGELKKATDSEVIRRESTITTQITEINPAKKSEVKSLNEKVDSAFKEKLASAGKTWIDKATLDDVVKTLSGDPAFRQLTEPQSMKESRNQYEQATRDIQILNEQFKGNNGEAYQKALEPLIANFEKVQSKYLQDLTKYQENITKAIEKRDAGGNIKVEALKTLAPDLTKQVSSTRTIETIYEIYKDSEGNEVLVSNSNQEALNAVRNAQDVYFNQTIHDLPGQLQISDSGLITRDINGKAIALDDTASRKQALAELKEKLGKKFDSTNNPNFAKLEAINSAESVWKGENISRIVTTVNEVEFHTSGNSTDLNFTAIQNSNGSTWRDIASAAKEVGGTEVLVTSIVRPNSSHSEGNALDIGAITFTNPIPYSISYDKNSMSISAEPPKEVRVFLDKISENSSIGFIAHPWEVRIGGTTYPNVFSSVRSELWGKGNIGDSNSSLTKAEIDEIYRVMGSQPNISFNPNTDAGRDIMTQMWNHRHHLHVSETK